MTAILLTRIDFDSMENSLCYARVRTIVGVFTEPKPDAKIDAYLAELPPAQTIEGWDKQTYPQYERAEIQVF